jgi:virginiamycin B lyase
MVSARQVYGGETLNVSVWNLEGTGISLPVIVRESVDSTGKVWFGSFWAARIGCLNPSTNEVKIWITPEVGAVTTVSVDGADKVWFTHIDRIGRFDPSTNFFTVWPVDGIDFQFEQNLPSALVSLDSQGNAFFSILRTNKIGRINPATNELTEWVIPTSDSKPGYAMVDANDNVWFAELAGNKIGRLNPYTNEITEWPIPTPDSYPSGLYVAGGLVYFAEYNGRKIGRLNPNTNQMTQWSLSGLPGYLLLGIFIDSGGNAWFTAIHGFYYGTSELYPYRLGIDDILTYWPFAAFSCYGATVDTKMNVGDVYVSGYVSGTGNAILRFRPATP